MYHKASIAPLSSTQISKILNGHSVRISAGNGHDIELSKEQLKKFTRAQKSGKGMTVTMDPFQMQNHQHLRGCGNLKKTAKGSAKRLIVAGTDRLIRSIEGSGIGGNIKATAKDSGKRLIVAGTDRAIQAIEGSSIGGKINRLKKYSRWTTAINKTIRDGIDTSGKAARVYYDSTGPAAQLGFGLKKRSPRKRRGGALMPAGIP
jgi:hypothetical protein